MYIKSNRHTSCAGVLPTIALSPKTVTLRGACCHSGGSLLGGYHWLLQRLLSPRAAVILQHIGCSVMSAPSKFPRRSCRLPVTYLVFTKGCPALTVATMSKRVFAAA